MIELKNITKEYNAGSDSSVKAIDNISLRFKKGEWCTILGPNASGKSTLLKLLAGSIFPTSGKIFLEGKEISNIPQYQRAKIFQFIEQNTEENIIPSMTVQENLLLVFGNQSFPKLKLAKSKNKHEKIREALSYFGMGLEDKLNIQCRFLSGGQKQAIVVAKAVLNEIKVLLLDEFVAAIDPKTAPVMLKIVNDIANKQGITVIIVSHDLEQVINNKGRVIFMNEGKITYDLKEAEISKEKLLSLYTKTLEKIKLE